MKTCILAIQRNERDIFEWIDYHLYKIGFDHIFIMDTNDDSTPLVVYNDKVTILHMSFYNVPTGTYWSHTQRKMYNDQIARLCDDGYEWCAIIDIDEYFDFKGRTVKEYIKDVSSKGYDHIEFRWENYTDNGQVFNSKANVNSSYCEKCEQGPGWMNNLFNWGKSLFRLDYGMTSIVHWMNDHTYPDGKQMVRHHESIDVAVVRHYRTKCLNDFLDKVTFRMFDKSEVNNQLGGLVNSYFYYNKPNVITVNSFAKLAEMKGIQLTKEDLLKLEELRKNIVDIS